MNGVARPLTQSNSFNKKHKNASTGVRWSPRRRLQSTRQRCLRPISAGSTQLQQPIPSKWRRRRRFPAASIAAVAENRINCTSTGRNSSTSPFIDWQHSGDVAIIPTGDDDVIDARHRTVQSTFLHSSNTNHVICYFHFWSFDKLNFADKNR